MSYLVLAYPEITTTVFEHIQDYRKENDMLFYNIVNPHFTIVFPTQALAEKELIKEVKKQSKDFAAFPFVLRCATINKDAFQDVFHTFLVPEEGFSQFIKLHDKLYSGTLKNTLRLDIDYIPHIGIGNSKDKWKCKEMVDHWNKNDFALRGNITQLSIVKYENNIVKTLEEIVLK